MKTTASELVEAIKEAEGKKTAGYDTTAEVRRITDGTAWVHIPGGVDETPVALTISAEVGDTVQIRVAGGSAWITGNRSKPPTDDTTAVRARGIAAAAQTTADEAQEIAEGALNIAEGVDEHFWYDNTGAHVTQVTQEDWNDSSSPNYHSGGNTLITSGGVAIRDGLTELAIFGANGAQIGQDANGKSRTKIGAAGMQIIQKVSGTDTQIANLGYGPGADGQGGTSNAPYYTLGTRTGTVGNYSTAEGNGTEASEFASHAEGGETTASGGYSHAEGYKTTASGAESHAEGYKTTASGNWAHAEGQLAVASDEGAHAEGLHTTASGVNAHAEGSVTTASGFDAHAEGGETTASGDCSHAGGLSTIAGHDNQTAIGRYNDNQTNTAFEIGNGTDDNARSNALTVDWSGNVEAAGDIEDGSGNVLSDKIESSFLAVSGTAIYSSQSISGNGYVSAASHSLTPPDNVHTWKALSVAGWSLNQHNVRFSTCYIDGNASVFCGLHNDSTGTLSVNLTIYVLWIRTA